MALVLSGHVSNVTVEAEAGKKLITRTAKVREKRRSDLILRSLSLGGMLQLPFQPEFAFWVLCNPVLHIHRKIQLAIAK
jgi:hypothetical protein